MACNVEYVVVEACWQEVSSSSRDLKAVARTRVDTQLCSSDVSLLRCAAIVRFDLIFRCLEVLACPRVAGFAVEA